MTTQTLNRFTICPASVSEAQDLANLAVMASDGLTLKTWESMRNADETALEVGRRRAARQTGSFSYRNADIAMQNRRVISAIISYPLELDSAAVSPDAVPPVFRPLFFLEEKAVGSWNINILATYPEARGQGAAEELLTDVEGRAKRAGFTKLSLIVRDANPARRLYEKIGFRETARAPMIKEGFELSGKNWILMFKEIA